MSDLTPHDDESPLAFVERADRLGAPEDAINHGLATHFGIRDDGAQKALKLKSAPFWDKFYLEHAKGICERGGSRYAATQFIRRKNGQAGQRALTSAEIDALVEKAGDWSR